MISSIIHQSLSLPASIQFKKLPTNSLSLVALNSRDAPIPDTNIGIGHFWWYRISIGYSVSIKYHNRYYYDVI